MAAAKAVIAGIDDGDPMVIDGFPYCDLSGQWADGLMPREVAEEILDDAGIEIDDNDDLDASWNLFDELVDLYVQYYDESITDEIGRAALLVANTEGAD